MTCSNFTSQKVISMQTCLLHSTSDLLWKFLYVDFKCVCGPRSQFILVTLQFRITEIKVVTLTHNICPLKLIFWINLASLLMKSPFFTRDQMSELIITEVMEIFLPDSCNLFLWPTGPVQSPWQKSDPFWPCRWEAEIVNFQPLREFDIFSRAQRHQ